MGEDGNKQYLDFSNKSLTDNGGRRAHFDIEVSAIKKSPGEAEQKNKLAKELYEAGAFKRENVKETLMMLDLMDFDGISNLKATLVSEYLQSESGK